jgi:osmotically-inducible protein OsmY
LRHGGVSSSSVVRITNRQGNAALRALNEFCIRRPTMMPTRIAFERKAMKTDAQLKQDVESELDWDPAINAAHVGVAVKDGVVTLTGHLETYGEKHAIERALQRVAGVRATAIELDVKLEPGHKRGDSDIAAAANSALRWNTLVPVDRVQLTVERGWVTLSGELDWDFQRLAAEKQVRNLIGVLGVVDRIKIKPRVAPKDVTQRIHDALSRQAAREAKGIDVTVAGTTATLRGNVHSWAERAAAQGAAWSAPGITSVVNELRVTA